MSLSNDKQNLAVSVLYELLNPKNDTIFNDNGQIELIRPYGNNANLSMIDFRGFSANVRNEIQNIQKPSVSCKIVCQRIDSSNTSGFIDVPAKTVIQSQLVINTRDNDKNITNISTDSANQCISEFEVPLYDSVEATIKNCAEMAREEMILKLGLILPEDAIADVSLIQYGTTSNYQTFLSAAACIELSQSVVNNRPTKTYLWFSASGTPFISSLAFDDFGNAIYTNQILPTNGSINVNALLTQFVPYYSSPTNRGVYIFQAVLRATESASSGYELFIQTNTLSYSSGQWTFTAPTIAYGSDDYNCTLVGTNWADPSTISWLLGINKMNRYDSEDGTTVAAYGNIIQMVSYWNGSAAFCFGNFIKMAANSSTPSAQNFGTNTYNNQRSLSASYSYYQDTLWAVTRSNPTIIGTFGAEGSYVEYYVYGVYFYSVWPREAIGYMRYYYVDGTFTVGGWNSAWYSQAGDSDIGSVNAANRWRNHSIAFPLKTDYTTNVMILSQNTYVSKYLWSLGGNVVIDTTGNDFDNIIWNYASGGSYITDGVGIITFDKNAAIDNNYRFAYTENVSTFSVADLPTSYTLNYLSSVEDKSKLFAIDYSSKFASCNYTSLAPSYSIPISANTTSAEIFNISSIAVGIDSFITTTSIGVIDTVLNDDGTESTIHYGSNIGDYSEYLLVTGDRTPWKSNNTTTEPTYGEINNGYNKPLQPYSYASDIYSLIYDSDGETITGINIPTLVLTDGNTLSDSNDNVVTLCFGLEIDTSPNYFKLDPYWNSFPTYVANIYNFDSVVSNYMVSYGLTTYSFNDMLRIYNEEVYNNLNYYLILETVNTSLSLVCTQFPSNNQIVFHLNESSYVDFKRMNISPQTDRIVCQIYDSSQSLLTPAVAAALYGDITISIDWLFKT